MGDIPFSKFLSTSQQRVDRQLETLLSDNEGPASQLFAALRYSVFSGGKRIRPVLAYAAAHALESINQDTDRVAAAIELVHAYSLIHDDLPAMDDDDLRRGKPTCHIAFNEATAILAGDALQTLAFEQLTTLENTSPETTLRIIASLAKAAGVQGMVAGQAIDIAAVNGTPTLEELEHMHRQKTGAMIVASITMGALSTGKATEQQLDSLTSYGEAIGLAFQVQDDILDVTANTAMLGKQQGADQAMNKPTYTSLLGLDGAREKATQLQKDALDALSDFDQHADQLRAIADYIVNRNY
ncbi:MAG: (2E,6E)-farnesyl diphosphate synthase [Porticoccus sp.]|nr:(2E,6E)-farnesyl diphosphate synthase [Porticoccus sp.]MBQ0806830.1 (2E,6E)-farnesyl diphosphate synthase [Porticoccus sp.]